MTWRNGGRTNSEILQMNPKPASMFAFSRPSCKTDARCWPLSRGRGRGRLPETSWLAWVSASKLCNDRIGWQGTYVADDTYDVFVSYSRADGRHAAEIDSVLHKGLKTFFGRRNLAAGLPWVRALEQAIGATSAVIVLIGPRQHPAIRDLAFVRQTRDPAFRPWSSTLGRA